MTQQNYYEILGVSKEAEANEIKKAYRSLSLKYHPDRNPDPNDAERYKLINEAYEILSDPQKREHYNMELKFGNRGMPHPEPGDIHDMFNMMFGGGFPGGPNIQVFHGGKIFRGGNGGIEQIFQQISKPQPVVVNISITLEQVYHGTTVSLDIKRGTYNSSTQEKHNMTITIPCGIQDNETIVIQNEGNYGPYNTRGDIHIQVKIENNTIFTRNNMDLIYKKHISLKEALCGFTFEIVHLNGKLLNMNNMSNPSIIKPDFKKISPGFGMNKNNQTGNLIVELIIDFPDSLTSEQIEGIKNLL